MAEFYMRILPMVSFFFIGMFFRQIGLFSHKDGQFLLRLVFYLFLPALTFVSVIQSELNLALILLPLSPIIPIAINFSIIYLILRRFPQPKSRAGVMYCAAMIMNTGFTLPFFAAGFGIAGFSKAILYDIGNIFFIYTIIYYVAVRHGERGVVDSGMIVKKFLYMPPLWAFVAGILFLINRFELPATAMSFLELCSAPALPVIMLSIGLLFAPKKEKLSVAFTVIFVRICIGLLVGLGLSLILPLDPLSRIVVIANCAAPCGYNTLVFAALENLDEGFAATIVSISILMSIFYIPLLFWIVG
jgi:hypothetical protein